MNRLRKVAVAATTATATFVRRHAKMMVMIALMIIAIIVVPWMMVQMSIMDSRFKLWVLDKIMPWTAIAWATKAMIWSGENPITAMVLQVVSFIMAGIFVWWAYRRRNPKVTPATSPTPATPKAKVTPAKTPAKPSSNWGWKVGGFLVWIAVIGFLGKAGYDNYTRPGHGVIGAIGDFIESGRTARTHPKKAVVTGKTTIITAPPAPEWSEVIPTPGPFSMNPDEGAVISVRKSNGTVVRSITRDLGGDIGNTFTIQLQSETKTPALVAVVK